MIRSYGRGIKPPRIKYQWIMHSMYNNSTLPVQNLQGGFREASGCYNTLIQAVVVVLVSKNVKNDVENIIG